MIDKIVSEGKMMTRTFLQWWLLFVLQIIILGAMYYYDIHTYVLENDQTYISFLLLGIWILSSIRVGYKLKKEIKTNIIYLNIFGEGKTY